MTLIHQALPYLETESRFDPIWYFTLTLQILVPVLTLLIILGIIMYV